MAGLLSQQVFFVANFLTFVFVNFLKLLPTHQVFIICATLLLSFTTNSRALTQPKSNNCSRFIHDKRQNFSHKEKSSREAISLTHSVFFHNRTMQYNHTIYYTNKVSRVTLLCRGISDDGKQPIVAAIVKYVAL